ncbi:MAG: translation initiation factor IF-3 [Firmicutes bacterium]|nr:translation initiation factor IF-3 [Bacillota bacterium]
MSKDLQINEQIRAKEVRVVGNEGEQLGIMSLRDALQLAQEQNVDLVKVAANAKPPVCRLMDYGRFKYENSKREREARKKQRLILLKEIRLSPTIEEHDLQVKVRNTRRFLEEGDKVKVTLRFRGRQIAHSDLGRKVLDKLAEAVNDLGVVERPPRVEGRNMIMILNPKG